MATLTLPDGPFTFAEAHRFELSRRLLRDAVERGEVRRVLRGVYVDARLPDTTAVRAAAVAHVTGPFEVVCDRTAAWLHRVDVFGYGDSEVLPDVETCVIRGHSPVRRSGVDGRTRDLLPEDVMVVAGVAVTTPLRTALDLGCALPRHRALGALDAFMHIHDVRREEMERVASRYRRRRGVIQLRTLIPLADARAESMRESWVRLDIRDHGLPAPTLQHWVTHNGVPIYRLDLAYPRHRVAVEYDGEDFHRRTQRQREADERRRAWLASQGWTVIVIDKHGLHDEGAEAWWVQLAVALRPRTRRLRWTRAGN